MERLRSWTLPPYPLQSAPPPPATPTEVLSSDEPVRLPRNMRALKDSQAPEPKGRNIIVCLDGTGDKFDSDNSNIVHLMSCFKKSDPSQITYYQSGIGTYNGKGLSNGINAAVDMAVGSGLGVHIRDAYRFLMQNYKDNDRICLFGFSRGAYTARCLAGMVHKVGLLPAHNLSQVVFAYQYYKDDSSQGWAMSAEFKSTFCMNASVHFIGVFDSVSSVGFIPRTLPLSSTPFNKTQYFRHAMALDEHRSKFKALRFQSKDHVAPNAHWQTIAERQAQEHLNVRRISGNLNVESEKPSDPSAYTSLREPAQHTDVLEVWFAGCHADVGGGAVQNEERHKLSQVPLRWMIRQCFECDTGIIFKTQQLAREGLDVHTLWPAYTSLGKPTVGPAPSLLDKYHQKAIPPISRRPTVLTPVDENDPQSLYDLRIWPDRATRIMHQHWVPEQVEDYFDSISPLHDQLVQAKGWWVLEFWPIKVRVLDNRSGQWTKKVAMNLARYRPVQDMDPNLHWTVQNRMQVQGYRTRVRLGKEASWNIVV